MPIAHICRSARARRNVGKCDIVRPYCSPDVPEASPTSPVEAHAFRSCSPSLARFGSGLVMALLAMRVVGDWRAELAASVVTVVVVGALWSPKGWARRREQSLY